MSAAEELIAALEKSLAQARAEAALWKDYYEKEKAIGEAYAKMVDDYKALLYRVEAMDT